MESTSGAKGTTVAPSEPEVHVATAAELFPAHAYPPVASIFFKIWTSLDPTDPTPESPYPSPDAYIQRSSFIRFYSLCATAMYTNLPIPRAQIVAETVCREYSADTGVFTFQSLLDVFQHDYKWVYCPAHDPSVAKPLDGFVQDLWDTVTESPKGEGSPDSVNFREISSVFPMKWARAYPEEAFNEDSYYSDEEEHQYFRRRPENRFLVLSSPGADVGAELSGWLAQEFRCVNTDVYVRAQQELQDESDLGQELKEALQQDNQTIPVATQAEILRRSVCDTADVPYRGYVFHDVLSYDSHQGERFLADCGLHTNRPTWVIDVLPPNATEAQFLEDRQRVLNAHRAIAEKQQRQAEEDEDAAKAAKELAKVERKAKREEARRRREERAEAAARAAEAGEPEGAPEDQPKEEEEDPAAEGEGEEEEEEEEEPQPVDEEGNPIEPEVIKAQEAERAAQRASRRLLYDLRQALLEGAKGILPGSTAQPYKVPLLADILKFTQGRGQYIRVSPQDTLEAIKGCILARMHAVAPSTLVMVPFPPKKKPPPKPTEPVVEATDDVEGEPAPPPADEQEEPEEEEENVEEKLPELLEKHPLSAQWRENCPVAYLEDGIVVAGLPRFAAVYRKSMYYTSSPEALEKFRQNPHLYLNQPVCKEIPNQPILVLQRNLGVLGGVDVSDAVVEEFGAELARELRYTAVTLKSFAEVWKTQKSLEEAQREELERKRKEELLRRKAAEEKANAEAKSRRDGARKAGGKKAAEEGIEQQPRGGVSIGGAVEVGGDDPAPPEPEDETQLTEEQKLVRAIQAQVQRKESNPNLVVNGLELDFDGLEFLYKQRLLPQTIVVLDPQKPKPTDEEAEEQDEDDNEQDAKPEEEEEEEEEELPPGTKPYPFELRNGKLYRRFIKWVLARITAEEEEEEAPPAEGDEEPAEGAETSTQEAVPKTPPLPRQKFTVIEVNSFGLDQKDLRRRIQYHVSPFKEVAVEAEYAEEPEAGGEGDDDEEDAFDPRTTPKPQLGGARHFCPVCLKQGLLIKGKPDLCLSYRNMKFLFKGSYELERFKHDPDYYALARSASQAPVVPPPRLWVLGIHASGKSTVSEALSKAYAVPTFTFKREFLEVACGYSYDEESQRQELLQQHRLQQRKQFLAPPNAEPPPVIPLPAPSPFPVATFLLWKLEKADRDLALRKAKAAEITARIEQRRLARERGELDEDDEEDEEEEPEEIEEEAEEDRAQRLLRAHSKVAADILSHEPYRSTGYLMEGFPTSEAEAAALHSAGVVPEKVVVLGLAMENFLRRTVDQEYARKVEARNVLLKKYRRLRLLAARREKRAELKAWRRRNIGADDE
eukprot:RCo033399